MKPIKLTENQISTILANIETSLKEGKFSQDSFKYEFKLTEALDKAVVMPTVIFTPEAFDKITALVQGTTDEIGWHGTVEKEGNTYTITDIIVYPQMVTGATCTTNTEEYGNWLTQLIMRPDDTFDKLRFQGHSHVNMHVSPSGVDLNYYDDLLQTMQGTEYFIFMIINKRADFSLLIYDFAQEVLFDTKDITTVFPDKQKKWAEEQTKLLVKKRTHTTTTYTPPTTNTQHTTTTKIPQYPEYPSFADFDNIAAYDLAIEEYRAEVARINSIAREQKANKKNNKQLSAYEKNKLKEAAKVVNAAQNLAGGKK